MQDILGIMEVLNPSQPSAGRQRSGCPSAPCPETRSGERTSTEKSSYAFISVLTFHCGEVSYVLAVFALHVSCHRPVVVDHE